MICSKCGQEVPDGTKVCPACGKVLIEEQRKDPKFKSRMFSFISTVVAGSISFTMLLLCLLLGCGWEIYVLLGLFVLTFVLANATYDRIEVMQEDVDEFNRQYGHKTDKEGNSVVTVNYVASVDKVKFINKQFVSYVGAKKKHLGIISLVAYAISFVGLLGTIVFSASAIGGVALNINGVYVQTVAPKSETEVYSAYKIENNEIYYSAHYKGSSTIWGKSYQYKRLGAHLTYVYTSGSASTTIEMYFTNFGQNIAVDRFGFNIQFVKTSVK